MSIALRFVVVFLVALQAFSAEQPAAPGAAGSTAALNSADPLVRLLADKGLISGQEASALAQAGGAAAQRRGLATLLRQKGILSEAELAAVVGEPAAPANAKPEPVLLASAAPMSVALPAAAQARPAPAAKPAEPPKPPAVIPAVAPLRMLPVDPVKPHSVVPDLKLGSGASLKLFGFVKASLIHDTSSPSGTDMPLPYLNGDTGPTVDPEFHIRARNMRIGTQFEWPDVSPKLSITGRFEADFEGNFTRTLNRNISTIRSSQLSLRTAWGRIDRIIDDRWSVYTLLGQDWTPFGSSTLPNLLETTGLGLGFGTLYERAPQARFGVVRNLGGKRNVKFMPEFALVLPAFGNTPSNVADQLGYGERQGADSNRPELQGRFVTQWQLDRAPGVAPAQFIVSWVQGKRTALVRAADVPAAYKSAFPNGGEVSSDRYGYTIELQAPTRALTLTGKYYRGADLRFYFVGGLYSNFNDTLGLSSVASGPSIDGASTVAFGMQNGVPVMAPERPVRTQGYMVDLGLPISRWFHASPSSRAAGWSGNLHYSLDNVFSRDARRVSGVRGKTDLAAATIYYKLNSLVTLGLEEGMYRTRAANNSSADAGGIFTMRGIPARQWHDIRSELALIFTF